MIWIPVLVILLVIYFCKAFTDGLLVYNFKSEFRKSAEKTEELARIVKDLDLEYELYEQLKDNYAEWTRLVQEFMGGEKEWGDYADYRDGLLKALIVAMLKHNKLPSSVVRQTGFHLWCADISPSAKNGNGISPKRSREMDEIFLLNVEEELNNRNIKAVAMCQGSDGLKTEPWMTLRAFIEKNGRGTTNYVTGFRFTHT